MSALPNPFPLTDGNSAPQNSGMKCADCTYFDLAYYQRPGDMPDTQYGFCRKGNTPIERATLLGKNALCRWNPARFQTKGK